MAEPRLLDQVRDALRVRHYRLRGTVYSLPYCPRGVPRVRTERARNEYTVPTIPHCRSGAAGRPAQ